MGGWRIRNGTKWMGTLALVLVHASLLSQHWIEVDDRLDDRTFMPYDLMYFNDTTNALGMTDVSAPSFASHFQKHPSYQNKDFHPGSSYWIKLSIKHSVTSRKVWLLEFYDQTIDVLEAYVPREDGGHELLEMGDNRPFAYRTILHKNFEIVLDMRSNEVRDYYFKVRSHEFADMRIAFKSTNYFVYYATNEYFLFGTFYGMILIISLYNFLVYLAIREIKNIFYICYMLSVAAYAMSLDGIGFQYIWFNHPEWNNYATGISLFSLIVWALIFTQRFLSTNTNAPVLHRILTGMIIARAAWFAIALWLFPNLLTYRNPDIIPLSLIFYTAIRVWRNGYRPARFFVIGYGVLFLGFFLRTLVYFNVLPFTTLSHYSLHFSFVFEMLFLTVALGDRIRILKDNRDRALRRIIHQHEVNMKLQDKVNRELEQKVKERTIALDEKNHELEQSNQRLATQALEINQINSILDLDNWKLKNRIKEVLEERLHEKTMDYEEFRTLYPDTLSCCRFLESLKWQHGYRCRKCRNEKYSEGSHKFSRRCSRCGYNESITAYTIFHSLKFPIEKAFYIAYLTVMGRKENTLEALGLQLEIGLNTVWAFRSKVSMRIGELESSGRKLSGNRWEDVILLEIRASRPKVRSPHPSH
jgi:two-component system, sensor histidine kinase LadS